MASSRDDAARAAIKYGWSVPPVESSRDAAECGGDGCIGFICCKAHDQALADARKQGYADAVRQIKLATHALKQDARRPTETPQ